MFTLFKWLLWLCLPSTLVLIGIAVVAGWLVFRKQFRPAITLFALDILLIVIMLPCVSIALGVSLERKFLPKPLAEIPKADVIVLLGGGVELAHKDFPHPECNTSGDRTIKAFQLWKAGKASVIIPTGEEAFCSDKPLLELLGVPSSAILCESEARDTAENATKTFEILQKKNYKKVLLVTSSWHLPRAMMLFQADNIDFIPVGCDAEASLLAAKWSVLPKWQKLPSFSAAKQSMVYVKEWLGILFYSFRKPKLIPAKSTDTKKS